MEGGKMINTRLEDITKHRIKNVTLKNFLLYKDKPKYGVEQLYIYIYHLLIRMKMWKEIKKS